MKRLILCISILLTSHQLYSSALSATGLITNNSAININIVFYTSSYVAATPPASNAPASTLGISSKGRINGQGAVCPPGQNYNIPANAAYMDVFADVEKFVHAQINSANNYTVNPGVNWIVTQDSK